VVKAEFLLSKYVQVLGDDIDPHIVGVNSSVTDGRTNTLRAVLFLLDTLTQAKRFSRTFFLLQK
jgi:hypothetical protein